MISAQTFGAVCFLLIILVFQPRAAVGQSDPSYTNSTTNAGGGIRGSSTQGSGSVSRSQPGYSRQRPRMIFVSGHVVTEDGTPLPRDVTIERVCGSRRVREAYPDSNGYFSFQIGNNGGILPDASDDSNVGRSSGLFPPSGNFMTPFTGDAGNSTDLMNCEIRASNAGYRSSSVMLAEISTINQIDVGAIILQPIAKVPGTMISALSLKAPRNARRALARGEAAARKKKFDEAEKNLRLAIEKYPKYATAWFNLGQVCKRRQRLPEARQLFEKAIEADPNYMPPYIELGRISLMQENWQAAADITERAIALDPIDLPEGYIINSLANLSLKKWEVAERSARKAQRLDSMHRFPQSHLILANIFQVRQDFAAAAEQLRTYLKVAPSASNFERIKAHLQETEKYAEALAKNQPPR